MLPVVGKENAGGGDCSGPKKRNRKKMKLAVFPEVNTRVTKKGGRGLGKSSPLSERKQNNILRLGCPPRRNCSSLLNPVTQGFWDYFWYYFKGWPLVWPHTAARPGSVPLITQLTGRPSL